MERFYLIALLCIASVGSMAQLTQAKSHTVELANGTSYEGDLLVYAEPIMLEPVFQLDETAHPVKHVRFFRNNHGYFANLQYSDKKQPGFAMRIKKGNIDLFELVDIEVYGKREIDISEEDSREMRKMAQGKEFQFYCVDGKQVKKANYANLRMDLQSNATSIHNLQMFRRYQWLQRGMILAGSSLLISGFTSQGANPKFTPFMALGVVLGGGSLLCETPKDDYLWQAVESYNGK